jgi:hypothetical protein
MIPEIAGRDARSNARVLLESLPQVGMRAEVCEHDFGPRMGIQPLKKARSRYRTIIDYDPELRIARL